MKIRQQVLIAGLSWALGLTGLINSQTTQELPLWPKGLPGDRPIQLEEAWTERPIEAGAGVDLDRSVKNIATPTLTVYHPANPNASRSAVVILPGGGFNHLAIDKEGHDIARWLNTQGITGVVVKYRVVHLPSNFHVFNASVPDTMRAIRLVRHHADDWQLDAEKIGVMGFSAGGYLAAIAGTRFDDGKANTTDPVEGESSRPNFIAPIYPLIELDARLATQPSFQTRMFGESPSSDRIYQVSPIKHVSPQTPPTFLVHAHDDNLSSQNSVRFYLALRDAGVPAELHVYSKGGHGYGIRQRGLPVSSWNVRFLDWMKLHGFLE